MSTLLERQREAKLTDAQLTGLSLLCRQGCLWGNLRRGWSASSDPADAIVAATTMFALVERGLAEIRHDIATATTAGQTLHHQITRGAA